MEWVRFPSLLSFSSPLVVDEPGEEHAGERERDEQTRTQQTRLDDVAAEHSGREPFDGCGCDSLIYFAALWDLLRPGSSFAPALQRALPLLAADSVLCITVVCVCSLASRLTSGTSIFAHAF